MRLEYYYGDLPARSSFDTGAKYMQPVQDAARYGLDGLSESNNIIAFEALKDNITVLLEFYPHSEIFTDDDSGVSYTEAKEKLKTYIDREKILNILAEKAANFERLKNG